MLHPTNNTYTSAAYNGEIFGGEYMCPRGVSDTPVFAAVICAAIEETASGTVTACLSAGTIDLFLLVSPLCVAFHSHIAIGKN
jgi:hypothetical protein